MSKSKSKSKRHLQHAQSFRLSSTLSCFFTAPLPQGLLLSESVREGSKESGRGLTTREEALWKSICWKTSSSLRLTSENKRSSFFVFSVVAHFAPFWGSVLGSFLCFCASGSWTKCFWTVF